MRRQRADFDCGPTAVANALEVHHRRVGLGGLRDVCATTAELGTDEDGLKRGLLHYGCGVDELAGDDPRAAHVWLLESIAAGRPALLCIDRWQHWVTVVGGCGPQIVIYDPARETGGTLVLRFKDLRRRWEAARRVRRAAGAPGVRFYAIGVGAPSHGLQPPNQRATV